MSHQFKSGDIAHDAIGRRVLILATMEVNGQRKARCLVTTSKGAKEVWYWCDSLRIHEGTYEGTYQPSVPFADRIPPEVAQSVVDEMRRVFNQPPATDQPLPCRRPPVDGPPARLLELSVVPGTDGSPDRLWMAYTAETSRRQVSAATRAADGTVEGF